MNRKNIILIAVFINAGLITAMLIAGLTAHDEPSSGLAVSEGGRNFSKLDENPLFGDAIDLALRKPSESAETPIPLSLPEFEKSGTAAAQLPLSVSSEKPAPENQIVHKLPSLHPDSNSAGAPSNSVSASPPAAASAHPSSAAFTEVTVKKGESLEKIAKAHRTTVDQIIKINQLPSSFLKVGQQLKVPTESAAAAASQAVQKQAAPERKANEASSPEYYTVKVGDNPWTIAMKHHIKVEELLRLNGLNEEKARKLKPGDRLRTR